MKVFLYISIFFIVSIVRVCGQTLQNKTFQKLNSADSVILVSHLTTYTPETVGSLRLVEKKKVNYKIIKERYHLNKREIDSLAMILTTPNVDSNLVDVQCFIPHHGILLFKNGKCSYFDICFGCRHFVTSKDIRLSDELSETTWNELESFFRKRNLNYEMPGKDSNFDAEN